jgi:hypothetical protein
MVHLQKIHRETAGALTPELEEADDTFNAENRTRIEVEMGSMFLLLLYNKTGSIRGMKDPV